MYHQFYRKTIRDKNCSFFPYKVMKFVSEFFNIALSQMLVKIVANEKTQY